MALPSKSRLGRALVLALASATLLSGCTWRRVRLWPKPMRATAEVLPPGDSADHPPGPEEVSVLRHADPVRVRPTGALSGFPLAFHSKRMRLTAGGSVIVAPGGRAEVLWPSGSSIVMFGQGVGWVGSPSRGEPIFELQEVDRCRLDLMPGDRVELVGGSVLSGDSGPYMIDRTGKETLRVRNQSKAALQLAFREETFSVDPGQSIVIPLVTSGGDPRSSDQGLQRINGPGFSVGVRGAVEVTPGPTSVDVLAQGGDFGERELQGLGVSVRLSGGETASFQTLGEPKGAPPPPLAPDSESVEAERARIQSALDAQLALQSDLAEGDPVYDQAQAEIDLLRAELAALEAASTSSDDAQEGAGSPGGS